MSEHSDEWCEALDREKTARLAYVERELVSWQDRAEAAERRRALAGTEGGAGRPQAAARYS